MEPEKTLGKGDSYWKPSFPGSMLIFGSVKKKLTTIFVFHRIMFFEIQGAKTFTSRVKPSEIPVMTGPGNWMAIFGLKTPESTNGWRAPK